MVKLSVATAALVASSLAQQGVQAKWFGKEADLGG